MAVTRPVQLGRYILKRRIAVGGMGEILLAELPSVGGFSKQVVIKRMHHHLTSSEKHRRMFTDEARILSRLNHPNLVQVYELAELDGHLCLVMECLEGADFRTMLASCRKRAVGVPEPFAVHMICRAAHGLHYAHEAVDKDGEPLAIVHRDVSPRNLFVTWQGHVKVVDFGIAKHAGARSTSSMYVTGNLSYMAPEQARGERLGRQTDVFSLGLVFYELLAAEHLLPALSPEERLAAIAELETVPTRVDTLPAHIAPIVHRMVEPTVELRYQSAAEVATDLEETLDASVRPRESDIADFLRQTVLPYASASAGGTVIAMPRDTVVVHAEAADVRYALEPDEIESVLETIGHGDVEEPDEATRPASRAPKKPVITDRSRFRSRSRMAVGVLAAVGLALLSWAIASRSGHETPPAATVEAAPEEASDAESLSREEATGPETPHTNLGTLALQVSPQVEVFHASKRLGKTPHLKTKLKAGSYDLALRNRSLGIDKTISVTIRAGRTTKKSVQIGKGKIAVHVSPWALVTLDGKEVGSTPLAPIECYEGKHLLVLKNPQMKKAKSISVRVEDGKTAVVNESLP